MSEWQSANYQQRLLPPDLSSAFTATQMQVKNVIDPIIGEAGKEVQSSLLLGFATTADWILVRSVIESMMDEGGNDWLAVVIFSRLSI